MLAGKNFIKKLLQGSALLLAAAFVFVMAGCVNPVSGGDSAVNIAAIGGVTAPVAGRTAVAAIAENAQYAGTVAWTNLDDNGKFKPDTDYTATITLGPKTGYTFAGVAANFFTVEGAETTTNVANGNVVLAVFPKTGAETGPITWTAAADGENGVTTSTAIIFEFSGAVNDLTADDITVTGGTGAVTTGGLSGDGGSRSLAVEVAAAGDVAVSINKEGIEAGPKNVAVYKQGETVTLSYTAAADGGAGAASTAITFTFSGAVSGLTADHITVANGTGAVTKGVVTGAGQRGPCRLR